MSEIIDKLLEKFMKLVNTWGLWRMLHDETLIRESSVEIEYKDGHKEIMYLARDT